MRSPLSQPDPRVIAIINHALTNGAFEPFTQVALVRCFSSVFGDTQWWRDMLDSDDDIARMVNIATARTMH